MHFQAHTAPGVYARAYLEGRLIGSPTDATSAASWVKGVVCPAPTHTRAGCPDFWHHAHRQHGAVYAQAPSTRHDFAKYLESRGLKPKNGGKIWTFIGDGEADEPEVLGTINIASREALDNLVLVINCNLQRLDGPVRGNGKIIQELERSFRGADWHVIKVIWGGGWDPMSRPGRATASCSERMEQAVDGDYQMYTVSSPAIACANTGWTTHAGAEGSDEDPDR